RGVAEVAIGWKASPGLVSAVQEIEADGAWNDRNDGVANPETAPLFDEPGLHAAGGIEPKRRAARERNAVDGLDRAFGSEQGLLARAGTAAAYVHRGNCRLVEDDGRDAGGEGRIVGVTDADAGNVGETIFHGADSCSIAACDRDQTGIYQPQRRLQP